MRYGRAHWVLLLAAIIAGCAGTPTVAPRLTLETGTLQRNIVAFNANATVLASAESNGEITLWSLPDGQLQRHWRAHTDSVHGLALLPGDRVFSASYDGSLALWTSAGSLLRRELSPAPIKDAAVDVAGDIVVTGHTDGWVRRWRLSDLQLLESVHAHRRGVRAVAYHAPTQRYASSGYDGAVYSWRQGEPVQALTAPPSDAHDLTFTPDGARLYGASWFKLFRWELADGALTILNTEHHGSITSIDLSADGRRLATISRFSDSAVQILDAETGAPLVRYKSHELCGEYVRFSPGERYLASTSDDATVQVWDLVEIAGTTKGDGGIKE
jgi:WD40 repeat protein